MELGKIQFDGRIGEVMVGECSRSSEVGCMGGVTR